MFRKALLSSTILVFSVCVSWGQAPANDNFADATVLSAALPITVPGTTVSATAEAGEPAHAPGFGNVASNSVWYQWQSTLDGLVDITTDGVTYDVVMAVYTGTALGNLVEVGSADNFFNADEGTILEVTMGTVYWIVVDGFGEIGAAPSESGPFDLLISEVPIAANDNFADRVVLPSVVGAPFFTSNNFLTTAEAGEPNHGQLDFGNVASTSVWYEWTAPSDVLVAANVPADFDLAIGVYTGSSLAGLTEVAFADLFGNGGERVAFQAVMGTTYIIAVDGFSDTGLDGEQGTFNFEIFEVPANDDFVNAQPIGSLPAMIAGTTVGAIDEANEPDHATAVGGNLASNTVWYSFAATRSETLTLTVTNLGLDFDPVIAVYTGATIDTLAEIAVADAGFPNVDESLTFAAVAGTTYLIAIDDWSGNGATQAGGTFTLEVTGDGAGGFYDNWIASYPSLTGANAGRFATPANDGVTNLMKLVLGLDPTIPLGEDPNRGNFPRVGEFNGNPAIFYSVDTDNIGTGLGAIEHFGEISPDLASWVAVAPTGLDIDGVDWVIELPALGFDARYVRLSTSDPTVD